MINFKCSARLRALQIMIDHDSTKLTDERGHAAETFINIRVDIFMNLYSVGLLYSLLAEHASGLFWS